MVGYAEIGSCKPGYAVVGLDGGPPKANQMPLVTPHNTRKWEGGIHTGYWVALVVGSRSLDAPQWPGMRQRGLFRRERRRDSLPPMAAKCHSTGNGYNTNVVVLYLCSTPVFAEEVQPGVESKHERYSLCGTPKLVPTIATSTKHVQP